MYVRCFFGFPDSFRSMHAFQVPVTRIVVIFNFSRSR